MKHTFFPKALPAIFLILVTACIFSPKTGDKNTSTPGQLEEPTTPRKVINNLQVSFTQMDIDFLERCLHPDYYYTSPSLVDSLDISWGRSEEVRIIGNLFDNCREFVFTPSEINIYKEYGRNVPDKPDGAVIDENDEHPDDIWYVCDYYITMDIFTHDYGDFKVQQDMKFKMVKDPDTQHYAVIRWVDETPDR